MMRVLQFPVVRALVGFVWLSVIYGLGQFAFLFLTFGQPLLGLLISVVGAAAGLGGYYAFARWYERRRPLPELALAPAPREFALGLAWGAGLFTLTFGLLALFGLYRVTGTAGWAGVPVILGLSILSGFVEELMLRAVFFRIMQEWLGTWVALGLSALLFGALHLGNPSATWVSALAIALEAGVLLGLAYQATGRVWLPIGLHLAWNFTQGGLFGVAVSGSNLAPGLLVSQFSGPAWLSGGEFGAEASIISVGVCLAGAAYFLWRTRRLGQVVAAPWQK